MKKGHEIWDTECANVRSLYKSGSLTIPARELARYMLDLVGLQEVRWGKGGTITPRDYIFSIGN
jgi:hypothetical protein